MINVLAIDDEPLALLQLQKMIEQTPYFNLVAACSSALEAIQVMESESVDTVFTDINMPDMSGLDFTRLLQGNPIIVFTTAYSQYAIEGYKVNAIDYLLKPYGQTEFMRAAMKVKNQYELIRQNQPVSMDAETLFIKVDYRIVRVTVADIIYIESQSEYLKIHLQNSTPLMVLMSIKRIMEMLPTDAFVRIHRSYIVNMNHVREISRMRITMDSNTVLSIGDSYKEETMKYINDRMLIPNE